jgi:anti-anti-sigma factor
VITTARVSGADVFRVAGRLGSAAAASLAACLGDATQDPLAGVIVDLAGVDYISSAGLQALESAGERLQRQGLELIVCNANGAVKLAFELAAPLTHVVIEASEPDALARVANR